MKNREDLKPGDQVVIIIDHDGFGRSKRGYSGVVSEVDENYITVVTTSGTRFVFDNDDELREKSHSHPKIWLSLGTPEEAKARADTMARQEELYVEVLNKLRDTWDQTSPENLKKVLELLGNS